MMNHQVRFGIIFFVASFIILANTAPQKLSRERRGKGREFPYLVYILKGGFYNCGGAIISERHILTAAHCVDRSIDADLIKELIVVSGSDEVYRGGIGHKVCAGTYYPGFDRERVGAKPNDIAVITLCDKIIFNDYQNKIDLPSTDFVDNTTGIMAGWGYKSGDETKFYFGVQKYRPKIFHSNFCRPYGNYKLNKGHLCAYHKFMHGSCKGVSGSPLVVNNQVIGIVSWGPPMCGTGDPEIYANVLEYMYFIKLVRDNLILN